ncbi:RDD family protein [Bacteriovorax sp. BSW11_IV]|uniref:RDD family protein n=1 Tax=Bacteriovorax sp. BSW11_IV TaxID=1353529 RepID=UPI000389F2D9|nr:RDD family protein [Bacteriovorax sp. BSW11_IV]EQC49086.1 RDD family protein [Bacteriovorax sp. BSW11_IV]
MNETTKFTISETPPKQKSILKRRVYAFVMDLVIIGIINKGLELTFINYVKEFFYHIPSRLLSILEGRMGQIEFVTFTFIFIGYFTLSYYLGKGHTAGKFVFELQVRRAKDDSDLTLVECVNRTLSYYLCWAFGMFPFLLSFVRKDHKGIPDFCSGTHVMGHEEIEFMKSLEDHGTTPNNIRHIFPEDPVSSRLSKESKAA